MESFKPIITILIFACLIFNMPAQNKTAKDIENVGEVVEKTNKTVEKASKVFGAIFNKKEKNKETNDETSSPNNSNNDSNKIETTINGVQKQNKAGTIHPDAVVLDADRLGTFNDGLSIVAKGNSTALINAKGEFVVKYNSYNFMGQIMADYLRNGIFTANGSTADKYFKGYVNSEGKEIKFVKGSLGTPLGDYLTVHGSADDTWFYDKSGNHFIISNYLNNINQSMLLYQRAKEQRSNLFLFSSIEERQKFGYKNKKNEVVIKPEWDEANSFSEGMAVVGKKNEFGEMKYGFIDEMGQVAVPLKFTNRPEDFRDGLAKVISNEKICSSCPQQFYGYIDKNGEFTINSKDWKNPGITFSPFFHGYAFSNVNVLNKKGQIMSYQDFLVGFGIPRELMHKSAGVEWDYKNIQNKRIMVNFKGNEEGRTNKRYHALLDLENKKTLFLWYADAKIGSFDPVSGLALVEEYGDKVRNNRKRIGYINEEGVFMIVKGETSKW